MRTLYLLPLTLLLFTGCDSGGDDDDGGGTATCRSIGATAEGSFSATTPTGSFSPNCFTVSIATDLTIVEAQEVRFSGPTVDFEEGIRLEIGGNTPGIYVVGFDEDTGELTGAEYTTGLVTGAAAESGTITITSVDGGVAGSFSFTTAAGQRITNGRFDVTL